MSRYHGSGSGHYYSSGGAHHFTISEADFERDSVLKRRRHLSPPKSPARRTSSGATTSSRTDASASTANDGTIRFRTRSKSKSRARESTLRRLPSTSGQEFFALGRSDCSRQARSPSRHKSVTMTSSSTMRARLPSRSRKSDVTEDLRDHTNEREPAKSRASSGLSSRTRSQERMRSNSTSRKESKTRKSASRRSKSSARRRHRSSSSSSSDRSADDTRRSRPEKSRERKRSKSEARNSTPRRKSKASSATPGADQQLERDLERTEKKMKVAKKELTEMEDQLATLQKQVDAKKYEVMDLQIVLDGLEKRRQLQQQFLSNDTVSLDGRSKTSTHTDDDDEAAIHTGRSSRGIKRVRVIDDDEDDDDEVEIVEPPPVKKEAREASRRKSVSRRVSPDKTRHTNSGQLKEVSSEPMSDYFWGRVDVAKLLVQPRIRNIPDGCARKIRHLAFNPIQQDVFATSSDDGGLILWKYTRNNHEVSKVVSFAPTSFRKEAQCPESIAWSPGGDRLAIAFRDPVDSLSEFCVARLHELSLTNSSEPLVLPRDRLKAKSTTLHTRGISAIEWIPSGYGEGVNSRGLVTAGSDHGLVMWEEHEALKSQTDFKWRVLHREHRSDVRSICMHSQRNSIYTGGLDGLVIRYDMNSFRTHTVMERRRPHISKINAVLENPHNPNLLLISSVEQSEHNLLLHDLRERYDEKRQLTMTLSWVRSSDSKSMSQYIVPRWSPGGFHVSCGSTSGLVNVWDVRVRGPKFPYVLPQQSINVHQKQVLHATWHPRYDAMFSVSHDRSLGLLTFR